MRCLSAVVDGLAAFWCAIAHHKPPFKFAGVVRCADCGRELS